MRTVPCLTIVSHFALHHFATSCLLSSLLITFFACCIFSLFSSHCYCSSMLSLLTHCTLFTPVYSLLFVCSLPLACSFSHAPLLSNAHLLFPYHFMSPCDPFHSGHFIPTSCLCFLVALCTLPTLHTLLLLMVHSAVCIFTICTTILVWVSYTPLAQHAYCFTSSHNSF